MYHQQTADLMEIKCAPPITDQRQRSEEQPDQAAGWLEEDETHASSSEAEEPDLIEADEGQADQAPEPASAAIDTSETDTSAAADASSSETEAEDTDDEDYDDLMKIDGIGPALQHRLYAFHIRTYAKLASLDQVDIETLERQLDDNDELNIAEWVRQAQELENRH